jgi:hypothetical protein
MQGLMLHHIFRWAKAHPSATAYCAGLVLMLIPAMASLGTMQVCKFFGAGTNSGPAGFSLLFRLVTSTGWQWLLVLSAVAGFIVVIYAVGRANRVRQADPATTAGARVS